MLYWEGNALTTFATPQEYKHAFLWETLNVKQKLWFTRKTPHCTFKLLSAKMDTVAKLKVSVKLT